MTTCDICGNSFAEKDLKRVPAKQIAALSKQGFVPSKLPQIMKDMVTDDMPLSSLWLLTVAVNSSDWGLCEFCAAEVLSLSTSTGQNTTPKASGGLVEPGQQATSLFDHLGGFIAGVALGFIVVVVLVYVFATIITPFTSELYFGDFYSWSGLSAISLAGLGCGIIVGIIFILPSNVTVIIAFILQPQETLGAGAEFVVDLSAEDRWKQKLREELGHMNAQVRMFTEDQWQMPKIQSADGIYNQQCLADIVGSMAIALDELGVADEVVKKFIHGDLENLRLPTSGRVILFQAIEASPGQLGQLLV